jgi:hypothetical protein
LKDEDSWRDTRFSSDDLSPTKKQPAKTRVDGVVAFGRGDNRKQYALVDGEWIATDTLPSGFLLGVNSGAGGVSDVD